MHQCFKWDGQKVKVFREAHELKFGGQSPVKHTNTDVGRSVPVLPHQNHVSELSGFSKGYSGHTAAGIPRISLFLRI